MGNEWKTIRLGNVASVQSGYAFKGGHMGMEGMPIIKIKNIVPPTVDVIDVERVPQDIIDSDTRIQRFALRKDDILIAMTGATVGKIGRMPVTNEIYYLNQRVGKVFLNVPAKADYSFLYYALSQDRHVAEIFSLADGSAQANISGAQIESLEITLPPLTEQRAIAHILGTLDDNIELNRRMNETLEQMAQALFKSWFVDFDPVRLRQGYGGQVRAKAAGRKSTDMTGDFSSLFPDFFQDSELGKIPKGWRVGTIGEDFNLTMGQSPPGETYNEIGDGTPFFQGCTDFGFRYPTRRVFCTAPTRFANPGDTLVSVRAPVGDINMALEKCCVGRGVAAIRHKSGSQSFTYCLMRSISSVFENFEAGGTVFGCINKDDFQNIRYIVPPLRFVKKFEEEVFSIDQKIEINIKQIDTLAAIRDTLLTKLLSGALRVKDAESFFKERGL